MLTDAAAQRGHGLARVDLRGAICRQDSSGQRPPKKPATAKSSLPLPPQIISLADLSIKVANQSSETSHDPEW